MAGIVLLFLSSCRKRPEGVLSPDQMTEIITNLQMADVAYKLDLLPDKYKGQPEMYMIDVMDYYKTDTVAYNKSMRYYGEHPEELKKIYTRVEKNLQKMQ